MKELFIVLIAFMVLPTQVDTIPEHYPEHIEFCSSVYFTDEHLFYKNNCDVNTVERYLRETR